jgi:hypothetical protein
MSFPRFDGVDPTIWKEKCLDHFKLFAIDESIWATASALHFEGNAACWLQIYKIRNGLGSWDNFV